MKRLKIATAIAVAGTVALAGCSQGTSTPTPTDTSTIAVASKFIDPDAKGPAEPIPGATKGGTVTVYGATPPPTFDPTDIYYTDSNEIAKLTYRTFTQYDIRDGNPVLVPDLTDLGTVSEDGLTWKFKLTGSFKYEDGSAVKIEDLAYAVKRSFAHDVFAQGPTYQLYYFAGDHDGDGIVDYAGPYTDGDTYEGVETEGTDTLVIHLAKKFNDLPFYLAFPLFSPIPKDKDPGADYAKHPISTGPYKFESDWDGASNLKLVRNDNWDPNTDPVRHNYPDSFEFIWGKDFQVTQQAIVTGASDLDKASIDYTDVDSAVIVEAKQKGLLVSGDSPCTVALNIDTRKITDINIRKAIALAYPYDDLYKLSGLNPDTAVKASTILPPSVPGYVKFDPYPGLSGTGNGDPAAAKALLEAANAVGYELSWYYNQDSPIAGDVLQKRTEAFEAAGFTVKPIGVPAADIRKNTNNYDAPVNIGQVGSSWCSDWPTGGSWFPVLFESHSVSDGYSWGFQQDPAIDAKIEAVAALPAEEATDQWSALDKELTGLYLALPIYYTKAAIVAGSNIGGTVIDGTVGIPFFLDVYVKA